MGEAAPIKESVSISKPEVVKNIAQDIDLSKALILDSHLIKTYRACEQKFYWFEELHIIGKGKAPAPGFGIAMHSGIENYRRAKMDGKGFTEAVAFGKDALTASYNRSMPEESRQEVMQDDKRSLPNAHRIYEGYCRHYEPFMYKFLYIEIPFALYIGQIQGDVPGGVKDVIYVGIVDAILEYRGRLYVNDLKTTGWVLNENWLEGFRMDQGLVGYTIAAKELLGVETQYALVHGIWVQKEPKTDKAKKLDEYYKSKEIHWEDDQLREWHKNTLRTASRIEHSRATDDWQMDFGQNCGAFGGCSYRPLCAATPGFRKRMVEMEYDKAFWTPLEDERLQKMSAIEI
jgi:hypothetical protein